LWDEDFKAFIDELEKVECQLLDSDDPSEEIVSDFLEKRANTIAEIQQVCSTLSL